MRKVSRVAALAGWLAPAVLGAAGGLFLLYAIAGGCGAALPYLDPTPELLAAQARDIHAAQVYAWIGAGLLLAGGGWWVLRWRLLGSRSKPTGRDGSPSRPKIWIGR